MKHYSYEDFGFFDEDILDEALDQDVQDSLDFTESLYETTTKQKAKRRYHDEFNESDEDYDYVQNLTDVPYFKCKIDGDDFEVNLWDLGKGKRSDFRYGNPTPRGINALERRALDREEAKNLNYEKEREKDLKRTVDIIAKRLSKKDKTQPDVIDTNFYYEK